MATIVLFRHAAVPPGERAAGADRPRSEVLGRRVARAAVVLVRRALTGRRLRSWSDRQLRDIGLERRDVADPLEACRQVRAWAEHGSAGWASTVVARPATRR